MNFNNKIENNIFINFEIFSLNKLKNLKFFSRKKKTFLFIKKYKSKKEEIKFTQIVKKKKLNLFTFSVLSKSKLLEKVKITIFKNAKIKVFTFYILNPEKKTFLQRLKKFKYLYPYEETSVPYSPDDLTELSKTPEIRVRDDILNSLINYLIKTKIGFFSIISLKILNLIFFFKFFPQLKILNQILYFNHGFVLRFKVISRRMINVLIMILLTIFYPKKVYRFSTRSVFPDNNNKFSYKKDVINNSFLIDKKNSINIDNIKEANLILRGESLNYYKIKNKKLPTFIVSCVTENAAKELKNKIGKKIFKNAIFVYPDLEYIRAMIKINFLKKMGLCNAKKNNKMFCVDGNETKECSKVEKKIMDNNKKYCQKKSIRYMRIFKNFYPKKPKKSDYFPCGSGLVSIFAIKSFVKKLNIYGWDYHLNFKTNTYSNSIYLLLKSINPKIEFRGHNYFEGFLINLYYAYNLSKEENINVYSFLGNSNKHKKLINNIEKVLFN